MSFLKYPISNTCLALLVLVAGAYFYNGGSWGQNARYDVIFSFVEPGADQFTFRIDRYVPKDGRVINTGDWSAHDGHFYSNKAPGVALLGIPVYALLYLAETTFGIDCNSPPVELFNAYFLNICLSVVPLLFATLAFCGLLTAGGLPRSKASLLSLLLFFATPLFPYSTQLWGHTTAAAALVFAVYYMKRERFVVSGVFAGLAVLIDFLGAIALPGLAVLALRRKPPSTSAFRNVIMFAIGGLPACLALLSYNWLCFGGPFSLPTDFTNPEFIDQSRFLGLFALPSVEALWQLTFGLMRGLFVGSPVLLLSGYGWWLWFKRDRSDPLLWCSLSTAILVLLANTSFNGWHGGSTISPRYLIVSIPFWVVPLKELFQLRQPKILQLLLFLTLLSVVNMIVITAVSPLPADQRVASGNGWQPHSNPLFGWAYSNFFVGRMALAKYPIRLQMLRNDWPEIKPHASWNAGQQFGLSGLQSLIPLLMMMLWIFWYEQKKRDVPNYYPFSWYKPLAISLMLMLVSNHNRLEELAVGYRQIFAHAQKNTEPDLREIYPLYPLLNRTRDRILQAEGRVNVRLDIKANLPGLVQRASEILYPLVIDPTAKRTLQIFERDGRIQLAYRPSTLGDAW